VRKKFVLSEAVKDKINEKWIKASIIGTIWAASEIVLGSFLHNLRFPFSGNILTAIGVVLLVSTSYKWRETGLFWRAGLVCAILKTMSPSAVIFGPMIAIFSEALLMELSVRLLGRTIVGFTLGAMLAMSWNLFQKIINYIIFYGNDIIEVYSNLLRYAQKQLHIQTDIVWMPILVLLSLYAIFGFIAAVTGIRTGRKIISKEFVITPSGGKRSGGEVKQVVKNEHQYSLTWLLVSFFLMALSFYLLSNTEWYIWSTSVIAVVILWASRYKRALRQLSRPGFWVFFVVITLITVFAFSWAAASENTLVDNLITGIQMNFRAVVIIVGFSVLGTELYNPVIREFFLKTSFKHLPVALELSAESLPLFISAIPDFKTILKDPVTVFYSFFEHADSRLEEIKKRHSGIKTTFIITAPVNTGKTSFLRGVIADLNKRGIAPTGFISEKIIYDTDNYGYDIVSLSDGSRTNLMRYGRIDGLDVIGRFSIFPEGVNAGNAILRSCLLNGGEIIIVDELGPLELKEKGWAENVSSIIENDECHLLITVRETLVEEVVNKWHINNYILFRVIETDELTVAETITRELLREKNKD